MGLKQLLLMLVRNGSFESMSMAKRDEMSLRKLPFLFHILMWLLNCAAFCFCWCVSSLQSLSSSQHTIYKVLVFTPSPASCVAISCLPFLLHYIEKECAASLKLHHHHLNFNVDLQVTCNNRRVSRYTCYCQVTLLCYEVSKSTSICVWDFDLLWTPFSFCGWF